jgi:hypothetical protein
VHVCPCRRRDNICSRPSAITSPDGLYLRCFHQVRERLAAIRPRR